MFSNENTFIYKQKLLNFKIIENYDFCIEMKSSADVFGNAIFQSTRFALISIASAFKIEIQHNQFVLY